MIPVYRNTKIYVMCSPQHFTGGPELLHQLVCTLTGMGYDACMFYVPYMDDPVHEHYRVYNNKYTSAVDDAAENILIVPETMLQATAPYRHIRKCIWWLSVDYFYYPYLHLRKYELLKRLAGERFCRYAIFRAEVTGKFRYHLVQSRYAGALLDKRRIPYDYLSDYLSAAFLKGSQQVNVTSKKDQVLYNPKKGFEFTRLLIEAGQGITWVPLADLSPLEVADLLKASKVYIDFGSHPGKDRFPREAAILQCCIITGKRGAAANAADVPIPEDYKIADDTANIPAILDMIRSCLSTYDRHIGNFAPYRKKIMEEEQAFMNDVRQVFRKEGWN